MFQKYEDLVFWKGNWTYSLRVFAGFVEIFSGKAAKSLKSSVLTAYPVKSVLFSMTKEYKTTLIQNKHSLVELRPAGNEN